MNFFHFLTRAFHLLSLPFHPCRPLWLHLHNDIHIKNYNVPENILLTLYAVGVEEECENGEERERGKPREKGFKSEM